MSTTVNEQDYLQYKGQYPAYGSIFTAMFIDLIVVNAFAIIILKIYSGLFDSMMDKYTKGYVGFFLYLICLLYVPVLSAKAQTVGQMFAKIKIRNCDGSHMNYGVSILRWSLSIFSPNGYGSKKVPWFDRKCNTVLINSDS